MDTDNNFYQSNNPSSHRYYQLLQYNFQIQVTASQLRTQLGALLDATLLDRDCSIYWAILGFQQLTQLYALVELTPTIKLEQLYKRLLGGLRPQTALFKYLGTQVLEQQLDEQLLLYLLESVRHELKSCFVTPDDFAVLLRFVLQNLVYRRWCKWPERQRFGRQPGSVADCLQQDNWAALALQLDTPADLYLPVTTWVTEQLDSATVATTSNLKTNPTARLPSSVAVPADALTFAAYYGARRCFIQLWRLALARQGISIDNINSILVNNHLDDLDSSKDYSSWAIIGGDLEIVKITLQRPIAFQRCCRLAISLHRQEILEYLMSHSPYRWLDAPTNWYVTAAQHLNQDFFECAWSKLNEQQQLTIAKELVQTWYQRLQPVHDTENENSLTCLSCTSSVSGYAAGCLVDQSLLLQHYIPLSWFQEIADDFAVYADHWSLWHLLAAINAGGWIAALLPTVPSLHQELNLQDHFGRTPLHLALQLRHREATTQLIKLPGVLLDLEDLHQHSVLQLIAAQGWQSLLPSNRHSRGDLLTTEAKPLTDGASPEDTNSQIDTVRDLSAIRYVTNRRRVREQTLKLKRGAESLQWH